MATSREAEYALPDGLDRLPQSEPGPRATCWSSLSPVKGRKSGLARRCPAVDGDDLTGDPRRVGLDQEADHAGYFPGFGGAAKRSVDDVAGEDVAVPGNSLHNLGGAKPG